MSKRSGSMRLFKSSCSTVRASVLQYQHSLALLLSVLLLSLYCRCLASCHHGIQRQLPGVCTAAASVLEHAGMPWHAQWATAILLMLGCKTVRLAWCQLARPATKHLRADFQPVSDLQLQHPWWFNPMDRIPLSVCHNMTVCLGSADQLSTDLMA